MKQIYIDTSVFYSALFDDEFAENAKKIITQVNIERVLGYTSFFTLTEFIFTLERKGIRLDRAQEALGAIISCPNLLILFPGTKSLHESFNYRKQGLDIGDSLHAAAMKEYGISVIATFDSDFDKIKEIKRITSV